MVDEFQRGIRAAILVVDTVELMHGSGNVNPNLRRNLPGVVRRGVQEWVNHETEGPLLLVIALTKSESWFRDRLEDGAVVDIDSNATTVLDALKAQYYEVLDILRSLQDRVAVVACPVQTVGNLVFDKYLPPEYPDPYPGEQYRRIRGVTTIKQQSTGYSPLYCDVPLRYVLNFALIAQIEAALVAADQEVDEMVDDLPWWARVFVGERSQKWLKSLNRAVEASMGDSSDLIKTLSQFVQELPAEPGFVVFQGSNLVDRSYRLWRDVWRALTP